MRRAGAAISYIFYRHIFYRHPPKISNLHLLDRMNSPVEPLQNLPQQPFKSPIGARLVLCNHDARYPDSSHPSSPGRGRLFDNIASTGGSTTQTPTRKWPAVVLMPEEYKLQVGGMPVTAKE